jgi:hypothetical protein
MRAWGLERGAAGRAGRAPGEHRRPLGGQPAVLERVEARWGLAPGQAALREAVGLLLQSAAVGAGFCLAIIAAQDELKCDAPGRALVALRDRCRMQAILPEVVASPQHLHALA